MRNRKNICIPLLCLLATSCGQNDIDIKQRPNDYNLDYWICETTNYEAINESSFYEKNEKFLVCIDSNYAFIQAGENQKKFPKEYVKYTFYQVNTDEWLVGSICITDPKIEIYGLSINSSASEIAQTLEPMGFSYFDRYSGFDPCYQKDNFEFRVYSNYFSIEFLDPTIGELFS